MAVELCTHLLASSLSNGVVSSASANWDIFAKKNLDFGDVKQSLFKSPCIRGSVNYTANANYYNSSSGKVAIVWADVSNLLYILTYTLTNNTHTVKRSSFRPTVKRMNEMRNTNWTMILQRQLINHSTIQTATSVYTFQNKVNPN